MLEEGEGEGEGEGRGGEGRKDEVRERGSEANNKPQANTASGRDRPEMFRWYCPIGSARTPEAAGPRMNPRPMALVITDIPIPWLRLSETSPSTALLVPRTPGEGGREGVSE